jgi:nitrous oxide reductase accessory protein NosL
MKQLFQSHRSDESSVKPISKFEGLRFILGGVLFCAVLISCACEKTPVKPVNINENDICFYCKSPITDVAFAAEFVTKDGFVRKFDDIGCFLAHAKKVGKKNIQAFYAMDLISRKWFPAEQLYFVRSDKIRTPRNGGIVAFQDASKAQQVATRFQAEVVKFDDILK